MAENVVAKLWARDTLKYVGGFRVIGDSTKKEAVTLISQAKVYLKSLEKSITDSDKKVCGWLITISGFLEKSIKAYEKAVAEDKAKADAVAKRKKEVDDRIKGIVAKEAAVK